MNNKHGNRVMGIYTDITERKQSEQALRESGECFNTLNITAPIGIDISSAESMIVYARGEKAGQQIEYSPEDQANNFRKILVIDDIKDIRDLVCALLEHLGHEVISAPDGSQGLARAKEFNPDIVFCDIGLPGMSGYEVARHIRQDNHLQDIYLIALSGYAQRVDVVKSKEAGFNCHLAKPFNLAKLVEILDAAP